MKFFAILRDSLREAIDTKVFYVMVGLSTLLALVAASISFKPVPAKVAIESFAMLTLNPKLDLEGDPEQLVLALMQLAQKPTEVFEVQQAETLEDRSPFNNRYRLLMQRSGVAAPGVGNASSTADIQKRLEEKFGRLGSMTILTVENVRVMPAKPSIGQLLGAKTEQFEVTVATGPAAQLLWPHETSFLFGLIPVLRGQGVPLGFQLHFIESGLVIGIGGWVTLLVSVIITAFFVPNMLRKGTVDLLLVKPIHRWSLLIYKYIGGLTFILLNTTVAVLGVWLALSLRSGVWASGFLLTILILTFFFAILYSISVLFGVLTQSPIAAILLTCGVWFILFLVGTGYQWFETRRTMEARLAKVENRPPEPEGWFPSAVRAVHFVLPRTNDLSVLNSRLLSRELITANQLSGKEFDQTPITWEESLTVSFIFIAIMLGLASWRFSTRDY